jgi:hypothetical protein
VIPTDARIAMGRQLLAGACDANTGGVAAHAGVTATVRDLHAPAATVVRWWTEQHRGRPLPNPCATARPGEEEPSEEELERRGIPDGWIYDDKGWCVFIETKVMAKLTAEGVSSAGAR